MSEIDHGANFVPIAITTRSGFNESLHYGAAVALDAGGLVAWSAGNADLSIFPRSSNKPMQADAMVALGLGLVGEELALACASHDGTVDHLEVVRRILRSAGMDESALANTADLPLDEASAERVLASGGGRTSLQMNCSGKHAAMVATCVINGWDVSSYLDNDHPLQLAITERISELCGGIAGIGVDGCGAPAHIVSIVGLARAFRTLAVSRSAVWQAMTDHPHLVGGAERDVTRVMRLASGLFAKDGAEGVFAAALPDGRAAVVKISDGSHRAAGIVLACALNAVGVDIDPSMLGEPLLGHGHTVGHVVSLVG